MAECILYYDSTGVEVLFFFIGLLIMIIIIIFIWILCLRPKYAKEKRVKEAHVTPKRNINYTELTNFFQATKTEQIYNFIGTNTSERDIYPNCKNGIVMLMGHTNFNSADEDLLTRELIVLLDQELQWYNMRLNGNNYIATMLFNQLKNDKVISKDVYAEQIKLLEERNQSVIKEFNRNINQYLKEIREKWRGEPEKNITAHIFEEVPQKANKLLNKIILNNNAKLREILQNEVQSKEEYSQQIMTLYTNLLLEFETELSNIMNNNKEIEAWFDKIEDLLKDDIIENEQINNEIKIKNEKFHSILLQYAPNITEKEASDILNQLNRKTEEIKKRINEEMNVAKRELAIELNPKKKLEDYHSLSKKLIDHANKKVQKCVLENGKQMIKKICEAYQKISKEFVSVLCGFNENEIKEYNEMKSEKVGELYDEIENYKYDLLNKLKNSNSIDSRGSGRILQKYEDASLSISKNIQNERDRQKEKMMDILAKKRQMREEDMENDRNVVEKVEQKQNDVIDMAIKYQTKMPVEVKNKILEDSRSHRKAVESQLMRAKLRQQKLLGLKRTQENQKMYPLDTIAEEEDSVDRYGRLWENVDKMREKLINEYKDKLILETRDLLKEQDKHHSELIAKHQLEYLRLVEKRKRQLDLLQKAEEILINESQKTNPALTKQIMDEHLHRQDILNTELDMQKKIQQERLKAALSERNNKKQMKEEEINKEYAEKCKKLKDDGFSEKIVDLVIDDYYEESTKKIEEWDKLESLKDAENIESQNNNAKVEMEKQAMKEEIIAKMANVSHKSLAELSQLIDEQDMDIDSKTKKEILNRIGQNMNINDDYVNRKLQFQVDKPPQNVVDELDSDQDF